MKLYSTSGCEQPPFDPVRHRISFGLGGRNLGVVENVTEALEDFKERFREPVVTRESLAEFLRLPKDKQDSLKGAAGWIIGAPSMDGSRRVGSLKPRTLVTLDFDSATPAFWDYLEANAHGLSDCTWFAHTTRKSTPEDPRLRMFVVMSKPVPTERFEPVARIVASIVDPELSYVDPVSFRPAQLMFLPTLSVDSHFGFLEWDGSGPLHPEDVLSDWQERTGLDPMDARNWPRKAEEGQLRKSAAKAEDPWSKPGIIGAFCRNYPIEETIAEHFSDLYAPGDPNSADTRYSWLHGGASNGLVIYEDGRFATSHHSSDPIAGQSVNAWDFARLVNFGELDGEEDEGLPVSERPSHKAMLIWASALPKVQDEMAEQDARFDSDFDEEEDEPIAARNVTPPADLFGVLDDEDRAMLGLPLSPAALAHPSWAEGLTGLDDEELAWLGLPPSRTLISAYSDAAMVEDEAGLSEARRRADAAVPGSDTWAGARHAARWRGRRLYDSMSGKWFEWSGQRWALLTDEQVARDAKETTAGLFEMLSTAVRDEPNAGNQFDLKRVGKLHGSRQAQSNMVMSARSEPGMDIHGPLEFDRDPMALTVQNGILDLFTGRLHSALPTDRVSKLAGCSFEQGATATRWNGFLERIMPDPEIRAFLARLAGYGLTGSVEEEVFILLHGSGANGKSVFSEVIEAMSGEFSGSFGSGLVARSRNDNEAHRLVNRLPGLRAAFVNETAAQDVFDSQRVKELASRDRIAARPLYGEAYDFSPTHKLWIRTNHLLGSLDAGDGFWRRCIPITFAVQIPEEKREKGLARRIIAEELPGVLNWALAGCLEWQRIGLCVPASIVAERQAYREDTDLMGQWLSECAERDAEARLGVSAAYNSFAGFCREQGASSGTQVSFSRALAGRGFKRDPGRRHGRRFIGIKLREEDRSPDFD